MMITIVVVAYVALIVGAMIGFWFASWLVANDDVCMDDEEEARQRRMDGY